MILSDAIGANTKLELFSVLILVLMDDTLWSTTNTAKENPFVVLILVLMDDTLWFQFIDENTIVIDES